MIHTLPLLVLLIFLGPMAPFLLYYPPTQAINQKRWYHHHKHTCNRIITKKCKGHTTRVKMKKGLHIRGPIYHVMHTNIKEVKEQGYKLQQLTFDSDSFHIGVDTYCSVMMSPNIDHFVTFQKTKGIKVRGIGNTLVNALGTGTIRWIIRDDEGRRHEWRIPNSVYCPHLPIPLLSPLSPSLGTRERRSPSRKRWVQSDSR